MIQTPRTFRDIDMSFTKHPVTRDIAKKTGDAAIIQSLTNLLSTGRYERLFQPDLFSNLKQQLFQPLDSITASAIRNEVENVINRYEPRVNLTEVNVTPDYDNNGYGCSITFFIVNQTTPVTIELFLERIR
jgi:phage baseplate assembly protein W